MRVLVDTNIVLDFLLEREPFVNDADSLFAAINLQQFEGFVAATTLTNIFYIVRKGIQSRERAREAVSRILTVMDICPVDSNILEMALASIILDGFLERERFVEDAKTLLNAIQSHQIEGFVTATTLTDSPPLIPIGYKNDTIAFQVKSKKFKVKSKQELYPLLTSPLSGFWSRPDFICAKFKPNWYK